MRLCNYIDLTWFSIVAMRWCKHVRFNVEIRVLSQWPLAERPPPLRYGKTTTQLRQKESLGSVKQKIVRKIQQNESAFCFEELVREALEEVSLKAV